MLLSLIRLFSNFIDFSCICDISMCLNLAMISIVDIHTSFNNSWNHMSYNVIISLIFAFFGASEILLQKWAGTHRWKFTIQTMPCLIIQLEVLWIILEVLPTIMEISFLQMLLMFRYIISCSILKDTELNIFRVTLGYLIIEFQKWALAHIIDQKRIKSSSQIYFIRSLFYIGSNEIV